MARLACVSLVFLGLVSERAAADVVLFTNGDQVQGKILSLREGELVIDSAIAGRITATMSLVSTFRTDDPARITLRDGTALQQRIETAQAGSVQIAPGGSLPPRSFPVERIRTINPPPEGIWHGQLKGSLDLDRGNTVKSEFDGGLNIARETSRDLIKGWGTYEADRSGRGSEQITTKRELHLGTRYQSNLSPRNYWYEQNVLDREAQANLDLRLRLGGGVGRRLVDTEKWKLSLEGGLAWVDEEFTDPASEDNDYVSGRIAWDALRRITPTLELFHTGEWFPSFQSIHDHLAELTGGARTRLTQRLSLEAKLSWEYDTTPAEGRDRQDVEYLLSLLVDF